MPFGKQMRTTAPAKTRRRPSERAVVLGILAAVVVGLFALGLVNNARHTSPGGGSSDSLEWTGLESQLYDHIQSAQQNIAASNTQGALNARTKIVADCQEGGLLTSGDSPEERAVRSQCATLGFPIAVH